jgi:hypothetical protein
MNDDCARFLEEFERLEKQMPANDPDKLKRFVGAIDNLFGRKHHPSPPFRVSEYAAGWMRDGISRLHCLEQIGKLLHMPEHQYRRGAGDNLIEEMNQIIRTSWDRLRRRSDGAASGLDPPPQPYPRDPKDWEVFLSAEEGERFARSFEKADRPKRKEQKPRGRSHELAVGKIGNLYVKYGLCPPFPLDEDLAFFRRKRIGLRFVFDLIRDHLEKNAHKYRSGSGGERWPELKATILHAWNHRNAALRSHAR